MYRFYGFLVPTPQKKMPWMDLQDMFASLSSWWLNQPIWKNMIVKLDHFPKVRGESSKNIWVATA